MKFTTNHLKHRHLSPFFINNNFRYCLELDKMCQIGKTYFLLLCVVILTIITQSECSNCSDEYKPICAKNYENNETIRFANECWMNSMNKGFQKLDDESDCTKFENTGCAFKCSSEENKVCAYNESEYQTFTNYFQLTSKNCNSPKVWAVTTKGECKKNTY